MKWTQLEHMYVDTWRDSPWVKVQKLIFRKNYAIILTLNQKIPTFTINKSVEEERPELCSEVHLLNLHCKAKYKMFGWRKSFNRTMWPACSSGKAPWLYQLRVVIWILPASHLWIEGEQCCKLYRASEQVSWFWLWLETFVAARRSSNSCNTIWSPISGCCNDTKVELFLNFSSSFCLFGR